MYNLIQKYIKTKFTALASATSEDFSEVSVHMDFDKLPANQKNLSYCIMLESNEPYKDAETDTWRDVSVLIELNFNLFKGEVNQYSSIIGTYLDPLLKYFYGKNVNYSDNAISATMKIAYQMNAKLEGLNKFQGDYFRPVLKMNLIIYNP